VAAILVLYHSQTGNTERRARAVAQGVAETEDSSVVLRKASMTKHGICENATPSLFAHPSISGTWQEH